MASPVSLYFTDPDPIITTAREGTRTILASALNHAGPQLETVLLTSSIAAIMGGHEPGYTYTERDWNTVAEAEVARLGKNAPGAFIYRASKIAAERAFWEFKKTFEPGWKMGTVNPAFVAGPPSVLPEVPEMLNETTKPIYDILAGKDIELSDPLRASVDVRDVARLLVWMVSNPEKIDGERFLAVSGEAGNRQSIVDVLRDHYPERRDVIKVGIPGEGYVKGFGFVKDGIKFDNTKTTRTTGIQWIGYEKMVLDTAKAFERYL
jgi:nucleoside-diphosphate-sugar epimerase